MSPRRLTTDERNIARHSWSADSRSVVFSSNRTGEYRLWRIALEGGRPEWISEVSTLDPGGPALSPAGTHLAFEEWSYEINIWEIDFAEPRTDSASRQVHRFASTRWDFQPNVALDGRRVAFVSTRAVAPALWVGDADTGDTAPLSTIEGVSPGAPRWFPDGRRIAFEGYAEGGSAAFLADAEGGRPVQLTELGFVDRAPQWSSDGAWIYFASRRGGSWQVWKRPAEVGPAHVVTDKGGYLAQESADGRFLFYCKYGSAGLWQRDATGNDTLVVADLHPLD
jgi:Tol biopolymer transport system component